MNTQDSFIQTEERTAIVDRWFREYCELLMRDSMKGDDFKREQQTESAYDIKA